MRVSIFEELREEAENMKANQSSFKQLEGLCSAKKNYFRLVSSLLS